MYIPEAFEQKDADEIVALVNDFPFAAIVVQGAERIESVHIPLLLESDGTTMRLLGHVAKANPFWQCTAAGAKALVLFSGPNGYISPSYYPSKREHGRVVPTWNYTAVHMRGPVSFVLDDDDWKLDLLNKLTQQHERNRASPWAVADAPEDYIQRMLNAIVGVEIIVESIDAKWKLSQNQPHNNKEGVVSGLANDGNTVLAALVKRHALD